MIVVFREFPGVVAKAAPIRNQVQRGVYDCCTSEVSFSYAAALALPSVAMPTAATCLVQTCQWLLMVSQSASILFPHITNYCLIFGQVGEIL